MTTERAELAEPLPVEEEAATIAELLTHEVREGDWGDEQLAKAASEQAKQRADALWAGDTRRALYGMAAAARRLIAEVKADEDYLSMLADEILQRNAPKLAQTAWLEEQVKEHAEEQMPAGSKHVDLPGICRIQYRDYARTVRIADAEELLIWAETKHHDDLYETRRHLRTNAAKEEAVSVLETSGELLPGVEDVPEHRTASIRWEGAS